MPLPDDYTAYPHRKRGMDQPFYDWDPLAHRKPIELKGGTKVVVVPIVPCAFFPLDPPADGPSHPDGMKTPYPDLRHFTVRDYGNRVGVFRILTEMKNAGIRATFAVDVETATRCAPLLETIAVGKHEIAAHGVSSAHIHHRGLSRDDEAALVASTRKAFPDAVTWLSPARSESFDTLPLLAEHGFDVCLDWEMDQRPVPLRTQHGAVTAIPHYNELSDAALMVARSQSESAWGTQILTAVDDGIGRFGKEGASCLAFTLTPYVSGQPFRIKALRRILTGLAAMEGIKVTTARKAAELFRDAA